MHELIVITLLAGLAIPVGGTLAMVERVRSQWLEQELRHSVIAFGGGVLLSAVALVLVPDGSASLPWWLAVGMFVLGGVAFLGIDAVVKRFRGSAAQVIAMLTDFVPEAIALGAVLAVDRQRALLLALLIGLQNLPEGFNAFRELRATKQHRRRTVFAWMLAMSLLGPASGLAGYWFLSDDDAVVGAIMLAAAGGILFLTFQDIAPQAELENKQGPALGAVLGFATGLAGHLLVVGT